MRLFIDSTHAKAVCLSVLMVSCRNAHAEQLTVKDHVATLRVTGARPLEEGLYALSKYFHWHIGFEEAALTFPGDMVDMTSPKYVPKYKDDRAYFPRGGSLSIQFPVTPDTQQPADPATVIQTLLREYHSRGYPGRYSFSAGTSTKTCIFVFPELVADETGTLVKVVPISKTAVTVRLKKDEKLIEVVQDVVNQMSKGSGSRVLFGGIATSPLFHSALSASACAGVEAAVPLCEDAEELGVAFWELLFQPGDKYYVLNFRE